jgi:hypothetical protein
METLNDSSVVFNDVLIYFEKPCGVANPRCSNCRTVTDGDGFNMCTDINAYVCHCSSYCRTETYTRLYGRRRR